MGRIPNELTSTALLVTTHCAVMFPWRRPFQIGGIFAMSHVPVVVVGAGPVGLACALRLASFGVDSLVLEAAPGLVPQGSRACCIQGDVVEIIDKIGVAESIVAEGVPWCIGRTYVGGRELFATEYARRGRFPAWVNLSQYRTQQLMLAQLASMATGPTVRWGHRVTGVEQDADGVAARASTPMGDVVVHCEYLIACDGIRSEVRRLLDVPWTGQRHGDRFLIADIRVRLPLAHERHFHYNPPFHPGKQLVMHAQPDHVWRIDWQLEPDADPEQERHDGRLDRRIREVVGDAPYEIRWLSTYQFNQRLVTRMRSGRVFFAGDAAHALPPYGARGMNSGIQDADNLAWKLRLVLSGEAPQELLETYHTERYAAAQENLRVTGDTIRFMVPPTPIRRFVRDVVLRLAPLVRPLRGRVDSGQMAEPFVYTDSPIVDRPPAPSPGQPLGRFAPDGQITVDGTNLWLRELLGNEFVALYFDENPVTARDFIRQAYARLPAAPPVRLCVVLPAGRRMAEPLPPGGASAHRPAVTVVHEHGPGLRRAYRVSGRRWCVIRPDGHVAAIGDIAGLTREAGAAGWAADLAHGVGALATAVVRAAGGLLAGPAFAPRRGA
jgi:2-polyprenyl-6-methoxyphenol hydroxylase-like FAD-dependent oxidoreductase